MIFTFLLTIIGVALGFTISADLSNHPAFPHASYAFILFWALLGGAIGWGFGEKISDHLDW